MAILEKSSITSELSGFDAFSTIVNDSRRFDAIRRDSTRFETIRDNAIHMCTYSERAASLSITTLDRLSLSRHAKAQRPVAHCKVTIGNSGEADRWRLSRFF